MLFHPSIEAKINHIGNSYEKLFADSCKMEAEIAEFGQKTEPILEKLILQNNQMAKRLKQKKNSEIAIRKNWETQCTIGKKAEKFLSIFSDLVFNTKPDMDEIYNYQHQFTQDLEKLNSNKNNLTVSEKITVNIEKQFLSLQKKIKIIHQKISHCRKALNDIQNIYNIPLN